MAVLERKIVEIDEDKCNGCGLCVDACHEGAIQMVNGKAKLVSDIYCDGLGDCLGPCPTGAISIVTRPAEDYDADAVAKRMAAKKAAAGAQAGAHHGPHHGPHHGAHQGGCPGSMARELKKPAAGAHAGGCPGSAAKELKKPAAAAPGPLPCGCPGAMSRSLKPANASSCACEGKGDEPPTSELMNWPVQLRLIPPAAPYLKGADILLAADCVAVATPGFHARYLQNRPVIISCPKLEDNEPQIAKLAAILETARPASLTVLRMEVPCCGGLVRIAEEAVRETGLDIPVRTVIIGVDGSER